MRTNTYLPRGIFKYMPLFFLCLLASCVNQRDLLSLQPAPNTDYPETYPIGQDFEIKIQVDDILSIQVFNVNPEAVLIFNPTRGVGAGAGDGAGALGNGYLVDRDGYIDFPVLGKIYLKGQTREEAKKTIRYLLEKYVKNPTVEIRMLNFHISMVGEVASPGVYVFPDERFTILEALAMAGGFTNFSNQTNILLIREEDNVRKYGRIDLSSADVFQSEFFYLQQNDVLYIEPLKEKTATVADPVTRIVGLVGGLAGLATIIITLSTN